MAFLRAVLFLQLLLSAVARPSINVNHSLFSERQPATAAPGLPKAVPSQPELAVATRRVATADILVTIKQVEHTLDEALMGTLEFLLVAAGDYTSSTFHGLVADITASLSELITGNPAKQIMAPPNDEITAQLEKLQNLSETYHTLLKNNIATVSPASTAVLNQVDTLYKQVFDEYQLLSGSYQAYARLVGAGEDKLEVYAHQLDAFTVRLSVQATYAILKVNVEQNLADLQALQRRFNSLLNSVTWGDVLLDLPDLTNVCQLQPLLTVTKYWFDFESVLQGVRNQDSTETTSSQAHSIKSSSEALLEKQEAFSASLVDSNCNPSAGMDEPLWKSGIVEVNYFRMQVSQAAEVYLQVGGFKRGFMAKD